MLALLLSSIESLQAKRFSCDFFLPKDSFLSFLAFDFKDLERLDPSLSSSSEKEILPSEIVVVKEG